MTFSILKDNGQVVSRSNVQCIPEEDLLSKAIKKAILEFDENLKSKVDEVLIPGDGNKSNQIQRCGETL